MGLTLRSLGRLLRQKLPPNWRSRWLLFFWGLGVGLMMGWGVAWSYAPIRPWVKAESFVIPREYQGKLIRNMTLPDGKKAIALTFDDGPTPEFTLPILEILKTYQVPATFFWVGKNLEQYPDILKQAVQEGHIIGNHTWHHPIRWLGPFQAGQEVEFPRRLIYHTIGIKTTLFRPPYGRLYNGLVEYAQQQNDTIVLWSVDSQDWRTEEFSPAQVVEQVVKNVQPGAIILCHDGRGPWMRPWENGDRTKTVQALPLILEQLLAEGYEFVTLPELLAQSSSLPLDVQTP